MRRRRPPAVLRAVGSVLLVHVCAVAWTWRDIRRRPLAQLRGGKRIWRVLSGINTLGVVAYWVVGRR